MNHHYSASDVFGLELALPPSVFQFVERIDDEHLDAMPDHGDLGEIEDLFDKT